MAATAALAAPVNAKTPSRAMAEPSGSKTAGLAARRGKRSDCKRSPARGRELRAGERLMAGDALRSANGKYRLRMQTDGNLVLYDLSARKVLWHSQTGGNPGAFVAMGCNGLVVVFSKSREVLYTTGARADAGTRLTVQNDGNLTLQGDGRVLWSSGADVSQLRAGQFLRPGQSRESPDRRFRLVMRPEGHLELVELATGRQMWSAGTEGNPGAYAAMQSDGNFVVYSSSKQVLYKTRPRGNGDANSRLALGNDGNMNIRSGNGTLLWESKVEVRQLDTGKTLKSGQSRRSHNGIYRLAMGADGNLTLTNASTGQALWSTQTAGNPGAYAQVLADGNFVVLSSAGHPLFQTATGKRGDASTRLIVLDDGNVVLLTGPASQTSPGTVLWSWKSGRL
jgi:hypothetical protein